MNKFHLCLTLADMASLKLALLLTLNFSIDLDQVLVSHLLLKSPFHDEFGPRTLICFSTLLYSKSIEKIRDHQKSFNDFRRSQCSASRLVYSFERKSGAKFKLRQNIELQPDVGKGKNSTRGVKKFSTWGVKFKNFERGSNQNSTRGVGPFFAKKNFSSRGVKIFQLGDSNSEILRGGVIKIQLGEWDLFLQRKIFQVGESKFFNQGSQIQ